MDKDDNRAYPVTADLTSGAPRPGHVEPLIRPWSRLGRQLVPLIGEAGFVALFSRSTRLLAPPRPWLGVDPARKSSALLLAALERDLAAADPAEAAAAHEELMGAFVRQLTSLIGPALTGRLLVDSGVDDVRNENQEEQKQ